MTVSLGATAPAPAQAPDPFAVALQASDIPRGWLGHRLERRAFISTDETACEATYQSWLLPRTTNRVALSVDTSRCDNAAPGVTASPSERAEALTALLRRQLSHPRKLRVAGADVAYASTEESSRRMVLRRGSRVAQLDADRRLGSRGISARRLLVLARRQARRLG